MLIVSEGRDDGGQEKSTQSSCALAFTDKNYSFLKKHGSEQ